VSGRKLSSMGTLDLLMPYDWVYAARILGKTKLSPPAGRAQQKNQPCRGGILPDEKRPWL
jgi:hypothetical protein